MKAGEQLEFWPSSGLQWIPWVQGPTYWSLLGTPNAALVVCTALVLGSCLWGENHHGQGDQAKPLELYPCLGVILLILAFLLIFSAKVPAQNVSITNSL